MRPVVAIDGPAASGKTSVSRELAKIFGWVWVSTGAFYRGLGFACLSKGINFTNVEAIVKIAHSSDWSVRLSSERTQVFYQSTEVTDLVQSDEVGRIASQISQYNDVRAELLEAQRKCGLGEAGLFAEGRDCGSVVFPDAILKVYLTADSQSRAERRAQELGRHAAEVAHSQQLRDEQDSKRIVAPMLIPKDALVMDSTSMKLSEVVDKIALELRACLQKAKN